MPPASFRSHLTMDPLPLAVCLLWSYRTRDFHPLDYTHAGRTTLCLFEAFPSRGNEKIGDTGYCVTYDTDSQSRNVLASPLGEEGHEVAKGVQANWIHRGAPRPANPVRRHPEKSVWTRERMIMIRYGDVTAERRHYNTLRPIGRYRNPQRRRRCRPPERSEHNLPPSGGHNTYAPKARAPSVPIPISPAGPDSLLKRNHAKKP